MVRKSRVISCHFCRSRKLRCNRQFPCSNCTSRGLSCPPPTQRQAAKGPPLPGKKNDEILDRLEKLEALLSSQAAQPSSAVELSGLSPAPTSLGSLDHHEHLSPQLQTLIQDAVSINKSCFGIRSKDALFNNLVVRTCPIRATAQLNPRLSQSLTIPPAHIQPKDAATCIWLPSREEAEMLTAKYMNDLSYTHHIVHGPSLKTLLAEVYDQIQVGSYQTAPGPLILLLSIFAFVAHSWIADDGLPLFSNLKEANAQAITWILAAFQVLDGSQIYAKTSLECVQGLAILTITIFAAEAMTTRAYSSLNRAISMARDLGLHRLDHYQERASSDCPHYTGVKAEIGRRVWWFLAIVDWMVATCNGPQEGTYSIHPRHMAIRKPLNINDEDLADEQEPLPRPLDEPTSMSYFIQRLRLAEVMRGLIDKTSLTGFDTLTMGYDRVLEVDAAMTRYLNELPQFFIDTPHQDVASAPRLALQRHALMLFVYGQRCRLHLPYFTRGTVDSAYAHSRKAAIENAQLIMNLERKLRISGHAFSHSRFKLGMVAFGIFMAVSTLIFDVCIVTEEDENDRGIREAEAALAWKILEEAQTYSPILTTAVDTLREVMRKHKVSLSTDSRSSEHAAAGHQLRSMQPVPNYMVQGGVELGIGANSTVQFSSGELAEGSFPRVDLEGIDWEPLSWFLDGPCI